MLERNLKLQVVNDLKPTGNYTYHILKQNAVLHFSPQSVFTAFVRITDETVTIYLNNVGKLIFVMR